MKLVIFKAQNRLCLQRHYHLRQLAYSLLKNNLSIRFLINFFISFLAKGETSLNLLHQCHRLVLILSSEFLKDHWNVFILQQVSLFLQSHVYIFC